MSTDKDKIASEGKQALPKSEEKPALASEQRKELGAPEDRPMLETGGPRLKELEDRMVRLQAEFENFKKRSAKENDQLRESANADLLLKLLPIMDEFELAIGHIDQVKHKEFRHGIEMIYSKLRDLVNKEGAVEMDSLGKSFDPYKHDAIRQVEGEEGKIVEVIQKGYLFKDKVLRHAKVVVGKGN